MKQNRSGNISVEGTVIYKANLRTTVKYSEDESPGDFCHDGPFSNQNLVCNVVLQINNIEEIEIFFYNMWASKCSFLETGDMLKLNICEGVVQTYKNKECFGLTDSTNVVEVCFTL